MLMVGALSFSACEDWDNPVPNTPTDGGGDEPTVNGIAELTTGIGDWDQAWVTPDGYFVYEDDMTPGTTTRATSSSYSTLTWMNFDATKQVSILLTKEDYFPER